MPLKVDYATDADAPRAFEIEHAAYGAAGDPTSAFLFPGPIPEGTDKARAAEVLERKHADPTTVWLKAVDDETGEMVVCLPPPSSSVPRPRTFD
jgi:hypothetical protein